MNGIPCRISGRFKPVYIFGDSHVLPLRDMCLTVGEAGDQYIINAHYMDGFRTAKLEATVDGLPKSVRETLSAFDMLDKHDLPLWRAATTMAINEAFAAGRPMQSPILVMSCGDIDLRNDIFRELGDKYDIQLSDDAPLLPGRKLIPVSEAKKLLAARLSKIPPVLRTLRKFGFPQSHLLMITPPSMEDAEFEAMHGYKCPKAVRAKLVTLANMVLKEECAKERVGFVDYSDKIADASGVLLPQYYLDGVHASSETAPFFMSALFAQVFQSESKGKQDNATLYRMAELEGAKPNPAHADRFGKEGEEFRRKGVCRTSIPLDFVSAMTGSLRFDQGVGNRHVDIDWNGNSATAFSPNLTAATPSQDDLKRVYDLFFEQGYAGLFQAALGKDTHIVNCRPLQSVPHESEGVGPQSYHRDGCPPGLYRALIYLTDVTEETGAFEYKDDNGNPVKVTGPAGTLVFFDANRLVHRGSPPRKGKRQVIDLCVTVRPERMPPRVMWSGMNNWPKDPFNFSVRNMHAWPPLNGERIVVHPLPEKMTTAEAQLHVLTAAQHEKQKKAARSGLPNIARLIGWQVKA